MPAVEGDLADLRLRLAEVASQNASLLKDRGWLHRRVDSMDFTDGLTVRVRTSLDFTIPKCVPLARDLSGVDVYYLPIAILAKWPPLMAFDLRDERGIPVPLLTSERNRIVDAAALTEMAPRNPSAVALELKGHLANVAKGDRDMAFAAANDLSETLARYFDDLSPEDKDGWREVKRLVGMLMENSLLWARVRGMPYQRRIVKWQYEAPAIPHLLLWRRALGALRWRETESVYPIARIDWTQNYHLQVHAPPGLTINSVDLILGGGTTPARPSTAPDQPLGVMGGVRELAMRVRIETGKLRAEIATAISRRARKYIGAIAEGDIGEDAPLRPRYFAEPGRGKVYRWNARQRAYLYIARPKVQFAGARIGLKAHSHEIAGGYAASVLLAIVMTTFTIAVAPVTRAHSDAAVTALLIVPLLMGYLVFRPGEHPLVRRHMAGVRLLVLVSGAIPVIAAIVLLIHRHPSVANILPFWIVLTILAWLIAGALTMSWLLPNRKEEFGEMGEAIPADRRP